MLNNDDALVVLNHLRSNLVNAGFGDFDAYAYSLVSDEFSRDPQEPLSPTLLRYLKVVEGLLERVGVRHIDKAKRQLTRALGLQAPIEVEVDLSEVRSLVGTAVPDFLSLEGSVFADHLAREFSQLYGEIEKFQYPDPSPAPTGGMTP